MRPLPALLLSLIACACPAADDDATLLERFATLPRTVYAEDGQERPRIVDSAFHLRGQRTFLIGGMVFATMHNFRHDRRWVTGDHPAYRGDLSGLGLDSIETAIPTRPAARALGLPDASWWETDADEWGEFLARAKGLPLVGDFSLIGLAGHRFSVQTVRDSKRFPASATLTTSHPFSGFDIFDPVGRRMYEAYFRTGVEAALSRRLNVWCWELWNEPGVLEPSQRWAEPFFAAWLERRHGSIAAANRAWGAAFPDFASAARTASQERKGPYADYLLFLGDSVGLFLDTMKMVVRSMDRRPDVAFAVQPHIATAIHTGHEGLDIWKVASRMEVCATEGGFGFGSPKPAEHGTSVLDAVMGGGWLDDLFQYDVYAGLAAAHRVPLADHEFYLARRLGGKDRRVPCRADDFTTAYWTMAVHGFDAVQHYVFNGDAHAWGTTAEAAAESGRAGYLNYQLLNPANLDPEALVAGNARFRREFAALHPFLDRSKRRTGSVALLYSLPSKRVLGVYREGYRNNDFSRRMASAYAALVAAQYPVDVVFEEELAERGAAALGGYRALVAPCSTHSLPTTTPALAAFAAAGGTVVGSADGFARDLYGQPLAAPLAAGAGIHLPPPARDATAAHAIVAALEAARVPRPLTADAGGALVEARLLRRGDERLCWLLNMGDRPLAATVRVEAGDGLHALLVSEDAVLAPPAGAASWSAAALADGSLRLVLPAQRRVLLLLTPDGGAAARLGCTRTLAADAGGLAGEQAREDALVAGEAALLATRVAVKPSRFEPSGIGRQVALPLAPEARDDLDAHPVLGQMFRHPQLLAGVQFACGQGPGSLLTLDAGHPAAHLDVNRTVRQLFVLHAAGDEGAAGSYTIRFASGRSATIPLAEGVSIARLQLPHPVDAAFDARTGEDLRVAWVGRSGRGYDTALHALRWRNPTPEDAVAAIELRRDTGTVWVAAVTVETP